MSTLRALLAALLTVALVSAPLAARQKPSREAPLWLDFDMADIPEPKTRRTSQFYDFFDATFFQQAKQAFDIPRYVRPKPAMNVNSVDGVPDSSWFTNRLGRRAMTPEEVRRGPDTGSGPQLSGPWTIVAGKASGITPGFTIRDAAGVRYLIKFDPPDYPEMASGAEVVATKLYHAAGFNTPENYIVRFRPEILEISPEAKIVDINGAERAMTRADLEEMLRTVSHLPDGRIRALASKFLPGKPVGPFRYYGVRNDDPNDWIPHAHRRELRGLRVVAGWLNDNDIREQNTLDVYVTEDGRRFLRHYLIDFGSALGSDTIHPNIERVGFEYIFDGGEVAKSFLSLGIYERPWATRRIVRYPSIGYIESDWFHPPDWKPNYPIVAFENMTVADAYWAAKIVASFTDEHIRAAVAAGEYSDPAAAEHLARVLVERRDKIARYWFRRAGGLDDFSVADSPAAPALPFRDLALEGGYASAEGRLYRYRVAEGSHRGPWQQLDAYSQKEVPLPAGEREDFIVELQVSAVPGEWSPPVHVHLGEVAGRLQVLGWQRAEK